MKLPRYRMTFAAVPEAETDKRLGHRSFLGGDPDWIQPNDDTPSCPGCNTPMTFVGQIDSINHDAQDNPHRTDCLSDEPKFMFGDVGLIYVFFCFDCLESASVLQCY
jgi:hypothetical protein